MVETPPKRKAKAKRGEEGVLGTLPASRPERIGRPRRATAANGAPAKPRATRAKRTPATANGAPAKPRAKRAKPAAAKPGVSTRPTAVRPAAPPLHARGTGAPPPKPIGAPTGTELVTTTIRAAGELAQIGLTVGGQMLKRTINRIPRP